MRKLLIASCALLAIAGIAFAVSGAAPLARAAPSQPIPFSAGRYAVIQNPNSPRNTILLDTSTGRSWLLQEYSSRDGEPLVWNPILRLDNSQEVAELNARNPVKAPATAK